MELATAQEPAKTIRAGHEVLQLMAGKTLKIETSPQGEEILEYTVPEGRVATVSIHIAAEEIDA